LPQQSRACPVEMIENQAFVTTPMRFIDVANTIAASVMKIVDSDQYG